MEYKYIEIIKHGPEPVLRDDAVVKRIDVTGMSDRQIEKIERGMNINLNHEHYCTSEVSSDKPLPIK